MMIHAEWIARQATYADRNERIWELRQQGWTLRAIGVEVGLTCERVRQICAKRLRAPPRFRWQHVWTPELQWLESEGWHSSP